MVMDDTSKGRLPSRDRRSAMVAGNGALSMSDRGQGSRGHDRILIGARRPVLYRFSKDSITTF